MNLGTAILAISITIAFLTLLAAGIVGLRTTLEPHQDSTWTPPRLLRKKKRAGTAPPRRGQQRKGGQRPQKGSRRSWKRDQRADLLPSDATVSFAAEREKETKKERTSTRFSRPSTTTWSGSFR